MLLSAATYLLLMSAGLKQTVTVLAVWLLAGLLMLPLAAVLRTFRFWLPGALAVAGVVVLFAVGSTVAFDSEHPKFTSVSYRVAPGGAPSWEAMGTTLDRYTREFVHPRPGEPVVSAYFPELGSREVTTGPAADYGLRPPSIRLLSDVTEGDRRTVQVRIRRGEAPPSSASSTTRSWGTSPPASTVTSSGAATRRCWTGRRSAGRSTTTRRPREASS